LVTRSNISVVVGAVVVALEAHEVLGVKAAVP